MPELKPCPFCGGKILPVYHREAIDCVESDWRCTGCGMVFEYKQYFAHSKSARVKTAASFEEIWNRRAMADTEGTRPTNLGGKCGSCAHAKPYSCGGSKSYVECTNPAHLAKISGYGSLAHVRPRTQKACKQYKRREDA